jgi:hypothetical protein
MLQVFETLHLMCIYLYFLHISLQILNLFIKNSKMEKFPMHFCLVYLPVSLKYLKFLQNIPLNLQF